MCHVKVENTFWMYKPYVPIGFALVKSKLDAMILKFIKPFIYIAKFSSGNLIRFLFIMLSHLKFNRCIGMKHKSNESRNSTPLFNVDYNICKCNNIFEVRIIPAVCL